MANIKASLLSKKSLILSRKKRLTFLLILIVLEFAILFRGQDIVKTFPSKTDSTNQIVQQTQDAQSFTTINREFEFPLRNDKGVETGKFKYTIESAELKKDILIQGKKATAVPGRIFLILNLKLANDSDKAFDVNTRDYVRLAVNNNTDWFAADIHNDPVNVQPISVKQTRLGFPVNEGDKEFRLQTGEIKGDKTVINITFQ